MESKIPNVSFIKWYTTFNLLTSNGKLRTLVTLSNGFHSFTKKIEDFIYGVRSINLRK